MFKRLRFYFALLRAFVRKDRKKITFGFIILLLLIFFLKILLPSFIPKLRSFHTELTKPTFIEGVVGVPSHPNPLFDSTETQKDISRLIFRGLTFVDAKGDLQPDLAESFEKISDTEYTFKLKKNVSWHDGEKFTAEDVIYTIGLAQDPQYRSELSASYKDVAIEKIDDYTLKFRLKEPFVPFPFATTAGIIPKHISLRHYKPIGTGPLRVK
jgi:peptide/nickel transport system substrate-binding protein